jgi:cytochrome c1
MKQFAIVCTIVFGAAALVAARQAASAASAFTAVQADAGRAAIEHNKFGACSDCHTSRLTGRTGGADELPPLDSLSAATQKMIRDQYHGRVPALVGPTFVARWAARTTKDLNHDFERRFADTLSEETRLNIVAYLLQANGSTPGSEPLTMATSVGIGSLVAASGAR